MPPTDRSGSGALSRAILAGLIAGAVWFVIEAGSILVEIGSMPLGAIERLAGLELLAGLGAGLVLVPLARFAGPAALAMGLTVAYGLIRLAGPPTIYTEVAFLIAGGSAAWIGAQLVEHDDDNDLLVLLHVLILCTVTIALAKIAVGTLQSTRFSREEPAGWDLFAILVAAPLVALVIDRMLALVIPQRGVRMATQLVTLGAAAMMGSHWAPTTPLQTAIGAVSPAPAGSPDVVVVVFDTTRSDHLSTYGYARPTSPRLTELARDGMNFTAAHSAAQWTVPGHASLFTGLYPSRHGAHYVGSWQRGLPTDRQHRAFPLADEHTTIAEILRDHGWATGAVVANFANLHRGLGMAQGFSYYDDAPGAIIWPTPHIVKLMRQFMPTFLRIPFRSATEIAEQGLDWFDRQDPAQPKFLFMNFLEPHYWLAAPPFDRWAREFPDWRALSQRSLFAPDIPHRLSQHEVDFVLASYDGQVAAMDFALGQVIDGLKARGRYENALIVVTADHGELLGEHGILGHGGRTMYEGLLHIPMVVKLPGKEHQRGPIATPVQQVDVLPTVMKTLGLPIPDECQGEAMPKVLHPVIAEEHINPEFVEKFGDVYDRAMRVVYDGSYKLIASSRGDRLLFDLASDPNESDNLATRDPARLVTMERQLESAFGTPTVATAR